MIETTIQAIVNNTAPHDIQHELYLVRDGNDVLYVGKSIHPLERIKEHTRGGSALATRIQASMPLAYTWAVELYTVAELEPLVKSYTQGIPRSWYNGAYRVEYAEKALIEKYHPCLNVHLNRTPGKCA